MRVERGIDERDREVCELEAWCQKLPVNSIVFIFDNATKGTNNTPRRNVFKKI